MTLTEASTTLVFYQTLVTGVIGLVLLPFFWVTPDLVDLALFSATGLLSGIAQFWWMQGCRFVPASVAAPFTYTSMIWSLALGYLIWSDVPSAAVLAGAGGGHPPRPSIPFPATGPPPSQTPPAARRPPPPPSP